MGWIMMPGVPVGAARMDATIHHLMQFTVNNDTGGHFFLRSP